MCVGSGTGPYEMAQSTLKCGDLGVPNETIQQRRPFQASSGPDVEYNRSTTLSRSI
jgi:hypothetical protein